MRKLLAILLLSVVFNSCEKVPPYEKFIGEWVAEKDFGQTRKPNMIYFGLFTDSVRVTRLISYADTIHIVIYDAPPVAIGAHICGNVLRYDNFWVKNHPTTPNCSQDSIVYYDVSSKIVGDTMTETGSYVVYTDGVEQNMFVNYYIAKFIKRQ